MSSAPRIRVDAESMSRRRTCGIRALGLLIAIAGVMWLVSSTIIWADTKRMSFAAQRKLASCLAGDVVSDERVESQLMPPATQESASDEEHESGGNGWNGMDSMPESPNIVVNVTISPAVNPETNRTNATLLMLARNSETKDVISSMESLEAQFNHKHHYPWTFLNEVPFTLEFKKRVRAVASGEVHFGLIRSEDWYPPDWIDEEKYEHDRKAIDNDPSIPYLGSMTYRNMCRFNSGFFFRQKALDGFKWYWRVEPGVRFPCDIPYDPFVFMIENNKRYSFTMIFKEYGVTIRTLWDTIKGFISNHSYLMPDNNALELFTNDGGESYNFCHFWSNFEIADLDFFRSPAYSTYFSHLDTTGKFFYERWGDAPVHSIGAGLLLPREQIHHFHDIGYYHPPRWNCPGEPLHSELKCACQTNQAFEIREPVCLRRFKELFSNNTDA